MTTHSTFEEPDFDDAGAREPAFRVETVDQSRHVPQLGQ
jgi:hypothetical protein